ncbi:1-phosphatidylinositol 4,5-bisphosphate phosphodiesterase delta-3-A-like isoform X1 [Stigmatopora argus]
MIRNRGKATHVRKNGTGTCDSMAIHPLRSLGLQDDDDVKWMLKGSNMVKIRSPHWQKRRTLKLLEDGVTVWCQSRKTFHRAKAQQSFSITEVECIYVGCHSETLQQTISADPEGRCLTVIFKGSRKNLDLLCQSHEDAVHWTRGIRRLQGRIYNMTQKEKLNHWIQAYLSWADQNNDDKMSYEEVQLLLQMINIDLNDQYARELFQKCDNSSDGRLEHKEIELFCRELLRRPELDAVFMLYSSNGCVLSAADLRDFLNDQAEDSSFIHAQSLIITYELNEWAQSNHLMTPNGFTMYMLSKENSVFNLEHSWVYQDMKQPLAHYFISSSHNTYLMKDQLTGESGIESYIRALNHGCRCVELDCWDGDNGQPVIYHGYTFTSKVSFVEVIKTINEYAFKASPYPLILSLENHCSLEQQAGMAHHMLSILGDKLLTQPIRGINYNTLPSPEDLKGKILVKVKKDNTAEGCASNISDLSSSDKKAGSKISPELSELVVYTCSVHFKSFQHAEKAPPSHMSSFSESEALRHVKDSGMCFVRHNSHHLTRVYPSAQRLQSSNYNPQGMWNAGCHFVALNFQTPGEEMDLNRGRFLQNGKCGYILKPSFMCQPYTTFNPENVGGGPGQASVLLTIRVISAQQLPKQERNKPTALLDPQVWVEIHGVPIDNDRKKTNHIQNNGFNPQWDCTFNFTINAPSLALVRFVVEDHAYASRNGFVGQYTLPFTSLRTGYRHVSLLKQDGSSLSPSSVFIHVKIADC